MRMGFRMVIDTQPDLEIVGEASNRLMPSRQFAGVEPDVVLMNVRMADLDGMRATQTIVDAQPSARIIILTTEVEAF
jgi:DNA-binding NarL/FixJ family response regulator